MSGFLAGLVGRELGLPPVHQSTTQAAAVAPRLASRYEYQAGPDPEPAAREPGPTGAFETDGTDGSSFGGNEPRALSGTQSQPVAAPVLEAPWGIPAHPAQAGLSAASAVTAPRTTAVDPQLDAFSHAADERRGPVEASRRAAVVPWHEAQAGITSAIEAGTVGERTHRAGRAGVVPWQAEAPSAAARRERADAPAGVPAGAVRPRLDPLPRQDGGPEARAIHVSIGRIEVRAATAPVPARARPEGGATRPMSLDEYVEGRR